MKPAGLLLAGLLLAALAAMAGCGEGGEASGGRLDVVASVGFLADLTAKVADGRARVTSLLPDHADPHAFEPAPGDLRRVADADLLVLNGAGLEAGLEATLRGAGVDTPVVEASHGLTPRRVSPDEPASEDHDGEVDPHFWLDPTLAVSYVERIRDALSEVDPEGAARYERQARSYIAELRALDEEIAALIETIAPERRLLAVNHLSHGYYADRYGLRIVGAVIPHVSSGETPSAHDLETLVGVLRDSGAPAIFVDQGEDDGLARQVAAEAGIEVVTGLHVHTLSPPNGGAATYVEMMEHDTRIIVEALR
jgi:ABC-type Zn uptake system ZnuABC Zn-binding protein ZnuA